MRGQRALTAICVSLLAVACLGIPAQASGGATIMVDDDGHASVGDCAGRAAAFDTIQGAIDDASNGATILVCPGTYVEQVDAVGVNGLTIRSVRPWQAIIKPPASLGAPYIVGIGDANDVTFQGFKVLAPTGPACDSTVIGILVVGGKNLVVRGNRIRAIGPDTLGDCGLLVGIGVGGGLFSTATAGAIDSLATTASIIYNTIEDYQVIGIAVTDTPNVVASGPHAPTRALVAHNSVRYFHLDVTDPSQGNCAFTSSAATRATGIGARRVAALRDQLRTNLGRLIGPAGVSVCEAIGVYQGAGAADTVGGGASGDIIANRVHSGPHASLFSVAGASTSTPLQLLGILQVDQGHGAGRSRVIGNLVYRNLIGILATDAAGTQIIGNTARLNALGIIVTDTVGATVRGNVTTDNALGILVADDFVTSGPDQLSGDVAVRRNDASGNIVSPDPSPHSCEDDSSGLGTTNVWLNNVAEVDSSTPVGICGGTSAP